MGARSTVRGSKVRGSMFDASLERLSGCDRNGASTAVNHRTGEPANPHLSNLSNPSNLSNLYSLYHLPSSRMTLIRV
jgi:hypothetical protein